MEFQIPKFIERQPKIIWTITFRQFIFLALVGGGLILLHLILSSKFLFWLIAIFVFGFSFALVLIKIQGRPFSVVLWNFLKYSFSSKLYLWQRKAAPPKILKKIEIPKIEKEEAKGPALKIAEKSRLKEIARKIEIGV